MTTTQKGFVDGQGSSQRETRWLTPKSLVEPLGLFDLDPCGAPGWELAKTTYLLENGDDGLRDPWFGRVWCNPPYGREAEPFLARMLEHNCGTALIFARTETRSFFKYVWGGATAVLFLKGRVQFLNPDGTSSGNSAGAPSVLVAYGKEDARMLWDSKIPGKLINLTN